MKDSGSSLLNNVPCSIFSFTNERLINYVNHPLLLQLGYTSEELLGQNVEKIFTLSTRIFYQTHFFPLLKLQGNVNEVFLTLQAKNKTAIPVLLNASQTQDDLSTVNICACIVVQQRKQYEDEILKAKKVAEEALQKNELLQRAQEQLEISKQQLDEQLTKLKHTNNELFQLNDIVAHDLQEPVRKIGFYVDKLKGEEQSTYKKKVDPSFDIILSSTFRIRKVLQSLQEYMSILTKEVQKTSIDLSVIIDEQVRIIKEQYPDLAFEVTVEQLPIVQADAQQLPILFYELLKNCVEFRSVERNLLVHIKGSVIEENLYNSTEGKYTYGEFARVTIEDNGIGFNNTYRDLIFRILKRLDPAKNGLGFGLAISKRIAENHMGSITAIGEENIGTKVTLTLPVN